jgi:PilZ domain
MVHERRSTPRYHLRCAIEVIDIATETCLVAVTSDFGLYGCFVETKTPFVSGRAVALKITHDGRTIATTGEVARIIVGKGMGIAFGGQAPADFAVLAGWLGSHDLEPLMQPTQPAKA